MQRNKPESASASASARRSFVGARKTLAGAARRPSIRGTRAGPFRALERISRRLRGALPSVGCSLMRVRRSLAPLPLRCALAALSRLCCGLASGPAGPTRWPCCAPGSEIVYKMHHDGWHETRCFWSHPAPIAANTGASPSQENSRRARLAVQRRRGYFLGCALGLPVHGGAVFPLRCSVGPDRVAFPARALCRRSGHFSVALHSRKKAGPGGARAGPA